MGQEESEHAKNLFFYPPSVDVNRQKDHIGLTEGLINFTRDFSPDKPCEALRCEKTRHAFFECEKDFWIVLVVNNPYVVKGKDKSNPEYIEDELGDSVLQAIVRRAYSNFRLFNGRMTEIASANSYAFLKRKLKLFMDYFIPTIKFKHIQYFTDIRGFNFMPVNKTAFLLIQYINNSVRANFPRILASAVMCNKQLIWSGLQQEDMFFIYLLAQDNMARFYEYFSANPEVDVKSTAGEDGKVSDDNFVVVDSTKVQSPRGMSSDVGYLTGPVQMNPKVKPSHAPRIYLQTYGGAPKRLVAFKYYKLNVFLVVEDKGRDDLSPEFYVELRKQLQADLHKLDTALSRQEQRGSKSTVNYRFLYFNALNLALKTSLNRDPANPLSMETIKMIRKIHEDFRLAPPLTQGLDADESKDSEAKATSGGDAKAPETQAAAQGDGQGGAQETTAEDASTEDGKADESKRAAAEEASSGEIAEGKTPSGDEKKSGGGSSDNDGVSRQYAAETTGLDTNPVHVAVKTEKDGWLVASKATQTSREFFVLIDEKNGNLSSIQEEVNRLARVYFAKIFMH